MRQRKVFKKVKPIPPMKFLINWKKDYYQGYQINKKINLLKRKEKEKKTIKY